MMENIIPQMILHMILKSITETILHGLEEPSSIVFHWHEGWELRRSQVGRFLRTQDSTDLHGDTCSLHCLVQTAADMAAK